MNAINHAARAKETAEALGISEQDALALEFLASQAWAHIAKDASAEAIFLVAGKHADGQISAADKDQLLDHLFNTRGA